ncbi:MAG: DHH family phosphoesterase [archaeon]
MPEITFSQAKEFLDSITSEDKVAIIHHDDGDGFCAGILYYDWCKNKGAITEEFTYSINKSKLKKFDLEKFNKIIICDLAPDFMAEELELIKDRQAFYTDHHPRDTPIPKEILELVTTDKGCIPSSRTAGELTGLKPWLALIGTVTDSGQFYSENQNFIYERLKELNMTLEEFHQNITSVFTNFLVYFDKDFKKAFKILQQINSIEEISKLKKYAEPVEEEVQKFVEQYENKKERLGDIDFYYFDPHFPVKAPVCGIISYRDKNQVYIFATPKSDGKHISFSARNTSQKMDMAELLRAGVAGLEDGSAGGHTASAGGMILAKDIEKFKENVRKFVSG